MASKAALTQVEQPDPLTITVRFDCARDDHAQSWQLFQSHMLGVAAVPPLRLTTALPVTGAASGDHDAPATTDIRTRVLSLPEAFYARTAAPALASIVAASIHDAHLRQTWTRFTRASPEHFPSHCAVQHHFRSRGWRLKSGLNYGGHYVLYRGAAHTFHSEYIVHVRVASRNIDQSSLLSWSTIQALTRVAADVKKTVLLCDVSMVDVDDDATQHLEDVAFVHSAPHTLDMTPTTAVDDLLHGTYTFYNQRFDVAVTAIRFNDIAATTTAAFAPQQVVTKKPMRQKRSSTPTLKRKRVATGKTHPDNNTRSLSSNK